MSAELVLSAALIASAFVFGRNDVRGLGEFWLDDPRLPNKDEAGDRVFGPKRPKVREPWRAPVLAEKHAKHRFQVKTNRTHKRWWFIVLSGDFLLDYATTSSPRIAQGWIDAVEGKHRR